MWYLIFPPIIIVVGMTLFLWLVSREERRPEVIDRLRAFGSETGETSSRFMLSLKEWTWRVVEKMLQRSKVGALRLHNWFQEWVDTVRTRRRSVSDRKQALIESDELSVPSETVVEEETMVETPSTVETIPFETVREMVRRPMPVLPVRESMGLEDSSLKPELVPRPMLRENIARPDRSARHPKSEREINEEQLIDRIARNPRDAEAYEALGDSYLDSGNAVDAKECYRQVLKLRPANRVVKMKIRRLGRLLSDQSDGGR